MESTAPWQLRMFKKTLKKKLRLKELKNLLTDISPDNQCLLITCGDNNGAMNYHLRELGGQWSWANLERTNLSEMAELLCEEVKIAHHDNIPFPDKYFDCVISIDVHEHLKDPYVFTQELWRVTNNQGHILITVPGGDNKKFVNIIKSKVGMTKEKYGHVKDGYSVGELKEIMLSSNIEPKCERTFSRFFTELIEFGINFLFVNVLSKKGSTQVKKGTIAPQTREQLESVEKTYRLYSLVYPFIWIFSQLDRLLFFTSGHVVIVEGQKR
jgi:SAM-dependent methyltransferase